MTEIVRAGAADRAAVLDLVERLLVELEERPDEFAGIDRGRVEAALEAAGDRFAAFLARDGGRAIGVLTVTEHVAIYAGGRYGVIDELFVAPERRSTGVGERLIAAARAHARERGWRRIDVTAPPGPAWTRSVRFYERLGFVFTGPKLRLDLPGV
ncbi:MAG TPA: GNAT family N-acetyltransferase [Thermoanaerobaculia bacterium]|nr:GNAT family N-acetyltransferase [Thermoanaerobaculia bacterium]